MKPAAAGWALRALVGMVGLTGLTGLTGCSSGGGGATTEPSTTLSRVPKTQLDLSAIPTGIPADPTTATPTTAQTVAPTKTTAPAPTVVATASAAPSSTLPFGFTAADRIDVEAAAIGWWEEWDRMFQNLPEFDPNPLLQRAVPASASAIAYATAIEKLANEGVTASVPTVKQIRIFETKPISLTQVVVTTCNADDLALSKNGKQYETGLGRGRDELTMQRTGGVWLVVSISPIDGVSRGKTCDDAF